MTRRIVALSFTAMLVPSLVLAVEDWTRIYAMNRAEVSPDGESVSFTWFGTNWTAPSTGGVARAVAEQPFRRGAGAYEQEMYEADAEDAALSPDGRRVAFRFRGDDLLRRRIGEAGARAGEIWLYDGEKGSYTNLLSGTVDCRRPVWLGNGAIAYMRENAKGGRDIWRLDLATGENRMFLSCSDGEPATGLASSDDGNVLVVRRGLDLWRHEAGADGRPGPGVKLVFHPAEGSPRPDRERTRFLRNAVNNGKPGRVDRSPDGREFVFSAGGSVWAIAAEGDSPEPRCLAGSSRLQEKDNFFSADGSLVYHLREFGDRSEIWVMKREDETKMWSDPSNNILHRCLVGGDDLKMGLSHSPDGKYLSWMSVKGGFFFMPSDVPSGPVSGTPVEIKPEGAICCWEYSWSPDNNLVSLVFVDGSRNPDVWLADICEPSKVVNVSDHAFTDGRARWTQDGREFYFTGQWEICGGERVFCVDVTKPVSKGCARLVLRTAEKDVEAKLATEPDWRLPSFRIEQTIDLHAYQELAFLKVWSGVRSRIPASVGGRVDWDVLKAKYLEPAKYAAGWGEFMVVLQNMFGELDASHLQFRPTTAAMKSWTIPREMRRRPKARPGCACCLARDVHEGTDDKWGYVRVVEMDLDGYDNFRNDIYREGRGREGVIVDLRGNGGGSYADAMLASIMTPPHGWSTWLDGGKGYIASHSERWFFTGKMIVLIDERVCSNAEMFAHSLKTLKRATLVGRTTSGSVLAASPFEVMDMGEYLMPVGRWWTEEGVEMEKCGAVPDVWVDDTPSAWAKDDDVQLRRAIELARESTDD